MKSHPDKKDILDTVFASSDKSRRSAVQTHLSRCRSCRERYELITALLISSDNRAVAPSEKLYLRIMDSLNRIEKVKKSAPGEQISPVKRLLKPAIAIAASALVIITVVLAIRYSETYSPESLSIAFEKIRGMVHINNNIAHPRSVIGAGSLLRTDNGALAAITYRDFIKIILSGNTILEVKKAEYHGEKEAFRLAFDLKEGTVYSSFSHRGVKIDYSFNTPKARIHAIGTEFLLNASGNKTILILTRGSVYIKSTVSGEEVKSTEGNEYIITSSIEERKIGAEGMKAIQSIKNYMKMKKSPKKTKSIKRSVSETDQHADKSDLKKT